MTKADRRRKFKEEVFKRDHYTCQVCHNTREPMDLDAHHITDRHEMPNGGYTPLNGITVCKVKCHMMVEQYHLTAGDYWEEGLHPNDLYRMIGSSYEAAFLDS